VRYVGLLLLAGACASATTAQPSGTIDAPGTPIDSVKLVDAAPDAPISLCTSTATCAAAMDIGSVSGDTGNAMVTANGYQAAWFRVRVTEDDSSVSGTPLRVTARLMSPAGTNYDLYLYVNTGSDVVECSSISGSGMSTQQLDSVSLSWGEGTVANGADDSRSVSIEVRPVSGPCSMSQPYQLTVLGDT
jgi:hypothetical protein